MRIVVQKFLMRHKTTVAIELEFVAKEKIHNIELIVFQSKNSSSLYLQKKKKKLKKFSFQSCFESWSVFSPCISFSDRAIAIL
jgi:hypothetical protein